MLNWKFWQRKKNDPDFFFGADLGDPVLGVEFTFRRGPAPIAKQDEPDSPYDATYVFGETASAYELRELRTLGQETK